MIGQSAGKNYAYLLGVYLGDGCFTRGPANGPKTQFRLNTIDMDFAVATSDAIFSLCGIRPSLSCHPVKGGRDNWALTAKLPELSERFVEDTKGKTEIPAYVFEWNRENRMAFIIGLMDSEGFVGANHKGRATNRSYYMGFKSTDVWVPDFIRLIEITGLRIGKVQKEEPRKPGYRPPTRFTIKMQSWIDGGFRFNIARKQDRVDAWASADAYTQRSRHPRRLTSETIRQTSAPAE